jgi:hypothetical protein
VKDTLLIIVAEDVNTSRSALSGNNLLKNMGEDLLKEFVI